MLIKFWKLLLPNSPHDLERLNYMYNDVYAIFTVDLWYLKMCSKSLFGEMNVEYISG